MEIRARYVLIGVFTLAVLFAGFSFVYWLSNAGTLRNRAIYQVRFESSVSGLLTGSAVLFNGIRVGEVTKLELNSADPRQVQATIAVDQHTPIRIDTVVSMDFLGLTASPAISLLAAGRNAHWSPKMDKCRSSPPMPRQARACRRPLVTSCVASRDYWPRTRSRCAA